MLLRYSGQEMSFLQLRDWLSLTERNLGSMRKKTNHNDLENLNVLQSLILIAFEQDLKWMASNIPTFKNIYIASASSQLNLLFG